MNRQTTLAMPRLIQITANVKKVLSKGLIRKKYRFINKDVCKSTSMCEKPRS